MSLNVGSVGTAYVEIGADLSALQKELSNAVSQGAVAADKIAAEFSTSLSHIDTSGFANGQASLFAGVAQSAGNAARQIGFDFESADSIVVSSADSMAQAVRSTGAAAQESEGYFQNIKTAVGAFGDALTPALNRLDEMRPMLTSIGTQAQSLGVSLSVGVTAPILGLAAAAIKSYADIDSLKRGLTSVAGSAAEAEKQFKDMIEVAKLPGLGLTEAVQGTIRLQAFGFSATDAKAALLAFGNAIATVGGGKAELDRVVLQLGQMAGASKVLTQDLRPIIQQVPQLAGILKTAFGADVLSEPSKRLEQLGVSTQQFIQTMITGLGKLPPVTGGIKNDLENFSDAMTRDLAKIGESLAPLVHEVSEVAIPVIDGLVNAFTAMPGVLQGGAIAIAGVAAVAGPALIVFGSMAKGLSDIIGIAKTFNDMRIAATAIDETATAATTANVALRTAAEAEGLLGTGAGVAATEVGLMTDAELMAAKATIELEGALGAGGLAAVVAGLGEALALLAGAAGIAAIIPALVSLLDPLKKTHVEMSGAAVASHALTAESGLQGDAWHLLSNSIIAAANAHDKLSVSAQSLVDKQKGLQQEYDLAKRTVDELTAAQARGVDIGNALALAHDKLTKAYKDLNPQIAENEKATKAATSARAKDSEEAKKQDAEATKRFEEAKKRETELVALQKTGVDVTKTLKAAKDELSAAFIALNTTVERNAEAQIAANAGTKQAADVSAVQRDALFKVSEAAREYVATMQASAIATLDHQIALQRVVGVLIDGVTYIHSFSDEQVKAAAAGTLTWKQIQEAVLGMTSTIKMVPQAVDVAGVAFKEFTHGTIADLGEVDGAITTYQQELATATTRVTENLMAVRVLRGEGVQHIDTLSDEIGKMGKQWVSATEAIYGNKAAIPDWVQKNTIAIVNGVRVVSDAAVAAHAAADGLKTGLDGVATGMDNVAAQSGTAVAGINSVATAADRAAASMREMNSSGASYGGGTGSLGAGDGFMGDNYQSGSAQPFNLPTIVQDVRQAKAGDVKTYNIVQNVSGAADQIYTFWTQAEIDKYHNMLDLQAASQKMVDQWGGSVSNWSTFLSSQAAATGKTLEGVMSAYSAMKTAATGATTAINDTAKATPNAALSLNDLTDQLWRLIDAGQSNSNAAFNLRTQIAALGGTTQATSNAFSDVVAATASFSAAVSDMAKVTTTAATSVINSANATKAAMVIGKDISAAPTAPAASRNTSPQAYASFMPLVNQGGTLVPASQIYIQGLTPEQIGAKVTSILQTAAFQ